MGGKRAKSLGAKKQDNILLLIFRVRAWKLVLVAVVLSFFAATLLRFDHIKMVSLRNEVLIADKEGDEEQIVEKMKDLHDFVTHHIIFNLVEDNGERKIVFGTGPFYLDGSYQRKAQAEIKKAQDDANRQSATSTNPNGNVYQKVASVCDAFGQQNSWQAYVDCWSAELAKYSSVDEIDIFDVVNLPDTSLYRYEYASPIWYPCFSGFVILICIILLIWAFCRMLGWIFTSVAVLVVSQMDKK